MMLKQRCRYQNLTRNSLYILFPAKSSASLSYIGKPFLAVSTFVWKELVHSLAKHI